MQRLNSLDTIRGIAVMGIVFWDFFDLLSKNLDWYAFRIVGNFPFYGVPPILFFFSAGVSQYLSINARKARGEKDWQIRNHVLNRGCILLLAGILLTIILREPPDNWGIFEEVALSNVVGYFLLAYVDLRPLAILLIALVGLGSTVPPYFSIAMPSIDFLGGPYFVMPNLFQRALFSGLFPFFPFFCFSLWGGILGRLLVERRIASRGLFSSALAMSGLGLLLYSLGFPMEYHQAGNIYSLACVIFSMGASTLILAILHWLQDVRVLCLCAFKPLTDCGRASFAICFWRYPLIYNPLIYLGLASIFPVGVAATLSIFLLLPTWLFAVAWIKTRRRFSLQIYGR
jgi:predicted acyltransferase